MFRAMVVEFVPLPTFSNNGLFISIRPSGHGKSFDMSYIKLQKQKELAVEFEIDSMRYSPFIPPTGLDPTTRDGGGR